MLANIVPTPLHAARTWHMILLRLFEITVATMALLVLLPLMLVVSLAILVESGRPILFRQQRLGQHGRPFLILKFKKFRDAKDGSGPHLTSLGDERMTWVGAILQRTKLDETPQFINVLAGDMGIVGPRPESLRFAECFNGHYRDVLRHKPGIFGPNQVLFRHEDALLAGRSNVEEYYLRILFPLKASVDLLYFSGRTVASDLRLLFSAVMVICGGRSRTEHLILGGPPRGIGPTLAPVSLQTANVDLPLKV